MLPQSVYIHIPFCTNKCFYCDFNSFVTNNPQLVWDYLDALKKEMELTFASKPPERVKTIFVGGGTPTFLDHAQMRQFLESVRDNLGKYWTDDIEFTMEANPGTTDVEKLAIMRELGVNRLSFGVQSFDNALLKRLGRIHDTEDVYRSIENARKVGFDNVTIDLMFGLPDQTMDIFRDTLRQAFALGTTHFSAYSLKVEENTLFHTLYQKDQLPLPSEDTELAMYMLLIEEMEKHGYEQYEISNFAKKGFESKHNKTYWLNDEYYGLGAGAHGYVSGERHVNAGPLAVYMQMSKSGLPRVEQFPVPREDAMEEQMILGLRLREGVGLERFSERFGVSVRQVFGNIIEEEIAKGMLEEEHGHLRLTKKGLPLGNEVFARFLR
ncbi:radical SAM family heme chaperone HemW [Brevibacillus centrosporus]|jgi:oxygen-independent coproporphyrinogen-3 oxidase|uniref:Heme chaperone HemW n=1 Tax=Brevibacillus centrosporus TaxID=54910 RepID=A0A1I3WFB9_9BACL|nr:radical SAM family heme chaperone HemW [Brevibacillus centrosporus]MEC2130946.1 radical SAM family heme chaperone HemW [Brevibacillus centrosporus]MED1955064.1 radical SAM family heme chaperone HemW [Brevibacillus centrosporus]MED4907539.1 radical SAM family heme chaperone HemW [Brevibacillus centrosporus]RNB63391.1 oxygen-independent coproporphyrinogen III oxidase [Brevibacillus centrosporus]SFK05131.1 oxygen-independent coproporphyrinogen-3 oxidase [Brevibacillus centrosporus]